MVPEEVPGVKEEGRRCLRVSIEKVVDDLPGNVSSDRRVLGVPVF